MVLPPDGSRQQQWEVRPDSGACALRNVSTGCYLGNEGDPNESALMIAGSRQSYAWRTAQGRVDPEREGHAGGTAT